MFATGMCHTNAEEVHCQGLPFFHSKNSTGSWEKKPDGHALQVKCVGSSHDFTNLLSNSWKRPNCAKQVLLSGIYDSQRAGFPCSQRQAMERQESAVSMLSSSISLTDFSSSIKAFTRSSASGAKISRSFLLRSPRRLSRIHDATDAKLCVFFYTRVTR